MRDGISVRNSCLVESTEAPHGLQTPGKPVTLRTNCWTRDRLCRVLACGQTPDVRFAGARCQVASARGNRWTSCLDAMRNIVLDRTIRSTGPCHSRKLRQQSEEGVAESEVSNPERSPRSCCILRRSWVGLRSPNSSLVKSCYRLRCSERAVPSVSCFFSAE